jgi:hypothetical protein
MALKRLGFVALFVAALLCSVATNSPKFARAQFFPPTPCPTASSNITVTGSYPCKIAAPHASYVYNAVSYGAANNHSTDDTTAIQAAATACASTGGTIFLPPGAGYDTTAPITLSSGCHVQGPATVYYTNAGGGGNIVGAFTTTHSGSSPGVYSNIGVRDLTIAFAGSPALYFYNVTNLSIENVTITGTAGYTAECVAVQYSNRILISGLYVSGCPGDSIIALGDTEGTITGNHLYNSADDAISVQGDGGSVGSAYFSVVGNTINTTTNGNGIRVEDSSTVSVAGNSVTGAAGSGVGIIVDADPSEGPGAIAAVTVSGNTVSACPTEGIDVDNSLSGTMAGVVVSGNAVNTSGTNTSGSSVYAGILVKGPALVSGNHVNASGSSSQGLDAGGILVYDAYADGATIAGNAVANSPGNGLVLWDGSGLIDYSNVAFNDNTLLSNGTNVSIPSNATQFGNTLLQRNIGYNPIGSVTVTPSSHAWTNTTGTSVTVYVTQSGSYTGTTTLTPSGRSAVTVTDAVGPFSYVVPPGATLTWGVGGSVTSDPSFAGVGD